MLVVMKSDFADEQLVAVLTHIRGLGFTPHVLPGDHSVAVGITGNRRALNPSEFLALPGVKEAIPVTRPFKLASRDFQRRDSEVRVGDVVFGPGRFVVIAGPCAVESEEQTLRIAHKVKAAGAHMLRGGAFKPRSSPYSFQGLGLDGLRILREAARAVGLPTVTEALDLRSLEMVYEHADMIQIGARNMQNFTLLQEVGRLDKPVMLKRGMSATIDEWLMAAEYILEQGNSRIVLCERGVRSFDPYTRNILDLSAVPVIKGLSHLPVMVDPSHGTGQRDKVIPMALASLAAGANAVMVDVHDRPGEALCDGPQALLPEEFQSLRTQLGRLAEVMAVTLQPSAARATP